MTIAEAFIEDGIQEGLQRGLQEGRQEGASDLLEKQVRRRFSRTVTAHHLHLIEEADSETLACWGEKLMEAMNIEEIFRS